MTIIEPVESRVYRLEDELNRLAGTLVNGMPTLGKATAALWWLGHRQMNWASHNLLTPNQATGGDALSSAEDFVALDGQLLEAVEGDAVIGNTVIKITASVAQARAVHVDMLLSAIAFSDDIPVEPWNYYTASIYTRLQPAFQDTARGNHVSLYWLDANGDLISWSDGGAFASKKEWGQSWVTAHAPENAVSVRAQIEWEQAPGDVLFVDKAILYNGHDQAAWAMPGAGAYDLEAGLLAHLNMKAGIFNPDNFLSVEEVCNRLSKHVDTEAALALSTIPTPNLNRREHG